MRQTRYLATGRLALFATAWLTATAVQPAVAQPAVALDTAVYVEHVAAGNGGATRWLEPADRLAHGDRVVTQLTWKVMPGRNNRGFTVTNALPRVVAYQQSALGDEDVSVDGGRRWGHLGSLTIGSRLAIAEDVTHVRWRVSGRDAGAGSGRITYAALVR